MKRIRVVSVAMLLTALLPGMNSCKKQENKVLPTAAFSFDRLSCREGDTIRLLNESKDAVNVSWTADTLADWISFDPPLLRARRAGALNVDLMATSKTGDKAIYRAAINILPDTVYRLTDGSRKVWRVVSLQYAGTEMLNAPCQLDDEVIFDNNASKDYRYQEGKDSCAPGTYLVPVPQFGNWYYRSARKELTCQVTEPSPLILGFRIDSLSHDYFKGTDRLNEVVLILRRP
jgi:hypothetical protein